MTGWRRTPESGCCSGVSAEGRPKSNQRACLEPLVDPDDLKYGSIRQSIRQRPHSPTLWQWDTGSLARLEGAEWSSELLKRGAMFTISDLE